MEPTTSTARVALKFGLLTGLGLIIYSMIIQLAGLSNNQTVSILGTVVTIGIAAVGIIYAIREFKSQNEGYISYGQGLGLGTLLSAVAGLISGIVMYLYLKFVDSSSLKEAIDKQREAMELQGASDEQIEMSAKFVTPELVFVFSILGMLFFGFILSLIIAAIMKKERTELGV